MKAILASLKDIPGVIGSFVLNPQGALVAKEMPGVYPEAIFPDLGRRLVSVGEVLEGQTAPFQELLLKFEGSWLFVRRTAHCWLSVLVAENINYPALRMATNVAFKQVADQLASAPEAVAPVAEPTPVPVPIPEPAKRRRMWRGQFVD
jgi:predicted regulator of Ras-like GTPase activity (Roadblock/LC7/MglB family)